MNRDPRAKQQNRGSCGKRTTDPKNGVMEEARISDRKTSASSPFTRWFRTAVFSRSRRTVMRGSSGKARHPSGDIGLPRRELFPNRNKKETAAAQVQERSA